MEHKHSINIVDEPCVLQLVDIGVAYVAASTFTDADTSKGATLLQLLLYGGVVYTCMYVRTYIHVYVRPMAVVYTALWCM